MVEFALENVSIESFSFGLGENVWNIVRILILIRFLCESFVISAVSGCLAG